MIGANMATQIVEPNIVELEQQTFEESDGFEIPPPDVVAYNELRSCADLFRMYQEQILEIRPQFQRELVWSLRAQTRFIDSLVKQLPIPSMCFSLDFKTQKWQVIDGLQRMSSIVRFLSGEEWRLARLEDVDPAISGQLVPNFHKDPKLHSYYVRVQNLALPLNVIRCDLSKADHVDYLFTIFHRLNSGSEKLNNQEIRNCIFSGPFNDFLRDLDQDPTWLAITGRSSSSGDRYRGRELILRFFALRDGYRTYSGKLAAFLNQYMMKHRSPDDAFLSRGSDMFLQTVALAHDAMTSDGGSDHRRTGLSVLEAVLVGVSLNLDTLKTLPRQRLREKFAELLESEEFSDEKLKEGLSGKPRVLGRISTAERVFSGQ